LRELWCRVRQRCPLGDAAEALIVGERIPGLPPEQSRAAAATRLIACAPGDPSDRAARASGASAEAIGRWLPGGRLAISRMR